MLARLVSRLPRPALAAELIGYGLCSGAALALDAGLLLLLTRLGAHYLVASAAGFLAGLGLVYLLSTRFVFRAAPMSAAGLACFLLTGLAGLVLTQLLMGLFVAQAGASIVLAKAMTAVIVFSFNFVSRRALLALIRKPAPAA